MKDQNGKDSYSLGYQYGDILVKQDWKIGPGIFSRGVSDGFQDKAPLLEADEMMESILSIRKRKATSQQRTFDEELVRNQCKGKAFLEKNSKK